MDKRRLSSYDPLRHSPCPLSPSEFPDHSHKGHGRGVREITEKCDLSCLSAVMKADNHLLTVPRVTESRTLTVRGVIISRRTAVLVVEQNP